MRAYHSETARRIAHVVAVILARQDAARVRRLKVDDVPRSRSPSAPVTVDDHSEAA